MAAEWAGTIHLDPRFDAGSVVMVEFGALEDDQLLVHFIGCVANRTLAIALYLVWLVLEWFKGLNHSFILLVLLASIIDLNSICYRRYRLQR
jgi:hypothetical protein